MQRVDDRKKIVVVGAGYAGILTAKKLEKAVRKRKLEDAVEITIIDKNPFHTMLTELHEVAAWRVEEESVRIGLHKVFAGRKVRVVTGKVETIDYKAREVHCSRETYPYDYLVLATGSQPIFFGVEGAEEYAFPLWSYEDAVRLREQVAEMFRAAAKETDERKKREFLTFVVVGCGFTGVEMAGELAELMPHLCARFETDPRLVSIINLDVLDRICTILPDRLARKVHRRLEKMGVKVLLETATTVVGKDYMDYETGGEVTRVETRTVIWTAGVESSGVAKDSQALGEAPRGRIQTDRYLRAKNNQRVYVGGDNIFFVPEGESGPVPQMVENCEASADTIAHNLLCDLTGKGEKEAYAPRFHGVMVSVGGRYGVAHVGLPDRFFGLPSFFAMLAKHFINIVYFLQVLGWNKVFSYLRYEFFTIRDRRSFVGGHFSNRSATFFLVPLRVFLGCYWLYEGLEKVWQGWLKTPMLTSFFQGANQFYENAMLHAAGYPVEVIAAAGGVDAAASATQAVAADEAAWVGDVVFRLDLFRQFRFLLVDAGEYAFKFQVGLVDAFLEWVVLPYAGVQLAFQIAIVLAEILIGLALVGGLFTTPAAAASLALQGMFLTSTGLYMSSWWMVFAGVAMLFGAGRVFSLDYYVLPWLKKKWSHNRFAKRWYLYHD